MPPPAKFGLRIRARQNQFSLTVAKNSGIRVLLDSQVASVLGSELPKLALGLRSFTTTEASPGGTRLVFASTFRISPECSRLPFSNRGFRGAKGRFGPQYNRIATGKQAYCCWQAKCNYSFRTADFGGGS